MRRLDRVIRAALLTATAILMLAATAWAGTPSGGGSAACRPAGGHTLAADRTARVLSLHHSVYGCVYATGTLRKLGGVSICNLPAGRVGPVALAGDLVAYGLERCGVDTGSSTVVVRNLAGGRRLADLPAGTLAVGPESIVAVDALVLRRDGSAGWIAGDRSLVSHQAPTYEVHRFKGGKSSLLEWGTAIAPSSLRRAGSRMTWRDGGGTRSASL